MAKNDYKKLEKVVVNVGVGRLSSQPNFEDKILPEIMKELSLITGQKAATRPATQSIAGFKTRAGTIVGLKTTLRGNRLQEFLGKFIHVVLPRVRDFRGIKASAIDAGGNLTIGLKEHLVFPEIIPELSKVNFGMEVTLVPKISDPAKAFELYKSLGIPFGKK
ncbi:MAG: 50S ribosomal protein L5 [Candidatus Harrisonbacteria bacterium RIFCSPLOWO2_02_FULL_45_10c]|uniref:50S ribosomal protein L5 n=1 Tax=Candidatus Harrisonbacteria bacterium RIFCSPLOWO2_02_FULL_45_10c TaxID=1798410 RepID=A0A1G1ZX37_9BACT|nr:MAG: 50S ribosomal protein L5 [Candidatus Harrisonbacteria bacterium RIFCSPLOWO2_02_FULL_45_10c]